MPVNLYDDRKISLRRPHGNGNLDIEGASYTRRKANVTDALVLVQPRKTRPCLNERLLMGRKEINQTKCPNTDRILIKKIMSMYSKTNVLNKASLNYHAYAEYCIMVTST